MTCSKHMAAIKTFVGFLGGRGPLMRNVWFGYFYVLGSVYVLASYFAILEASV